MNVIVIVIIIITLHATPLPHQLAIANTLLIIIRRRTIPNPATLTTITSYLWVYGSKRSPRLLQIGKNRFSLEDLKNARRDEKQNGGRQLTTGVKVRGHKPETQCAKPQIAA